MVRYTSLILLAIAAVATANKQPLHNSPSSQGLHTVHEDAAPSESQLRKLPVDEKKNDKKPGDDKKDQEKKAAKSKKPKTE